MVGVGIQDTRGLITGEAGLYKIPGVSSPGRQGYTRYQGFHHQGGRAIQDTRGLITREAGLYKIPGVSSLGRGVYEGTITSACKGGSLASIVVLTRSQIADLWL